MSKLFIEDSTLTAIGDAIREKTGKTALIAPGAMPAEIKGIVSGGGGGEGDCNGLHVPEEALVISGCLDYGFYYGLWDWYINLCGNRITTNNVYCYVGNVFTNCSTLEEIPFTLNFDNSKTITLSKMFSGCSNLKALPPMKNVMPINMESMLTNCQSIEVIPDDYCATWDWTEFENESKSSQGRNGQMIGYCSNLRSFPKDLICHGHPKVGYTNSCVYFGFQDCYSLTKIEDIYVPSNVNWTNNAFGYAFRNCYRLKKLTFKKQADGTPYTANWKSQTIDLSNNIGYGVTSKLNDLGFTDATKITNQSQRTDYRNASVRDTTPGTIEYDGWTDDYAWSTFGATAAREFFDSLPDTSAYLASAGGTNTIKLNRMAAMNDPFDKMSLLTEEDIAVAAAKGWTVSLV